MQSLTDIYDRVIDSRIYQIHYKGKFHAIRIKRYNIDTGEYEYNDAKLETIRGYQILIEFISKRVEKFEKKEYLGSGDSICTQEELNGEYVSPELTDIDEILSVCTPLILLYERGYI